ncbi:MAG: cytochrome c oxidase assembly protein [Alphaproteobacteria bacterium]|nr:MAG: cytochrome c oxidase assembly protein [Alphaproteobacteria bacterium]
MSLDDQNRRNKRVKWALAGFAVGMIALSFGIVPLYKIFCQVTGYGGTTQQAIAMPDQVFDREVQIRFNSDVAEDLPWTFRPSQKEVRLNVGESGLAFYRAVNHSDKSVTGMAIYNVTPLKAGQYFTKVDCFCFTEQVLEAGQEVDMPVTFFIDPEFMDDPDMEDVQTITLSYTFYNQSDEDEAEISALITND